MYQCHKLKLVAMSYDCNPHIQESPRPLGLKSPKCLKKVFPGLPAQSVKKVPKKSPNTDFDTFLTLFFGSFGTFSTLFWHSGGPGRRFWYFLGTSGSEVLGTPVYGSSNRKPWAHDICLDWSTLPNFGRVRNSEHKMVLTHPNLNNSLSLKIEELKF